MYDKNLSINKKAIGGAIASIILAMFIIARYRVTRYYLMELLKGALLTVQLLLFVNKIFAWLVQASATSGGPVRIDEGGNGFLFNVSWFSLAVDRGSVRR